MMLLAAGCAPPVPGTLVEWGPQDDLRFLDGRYCTAAPVVVVPDPSWEAHPQEGRWSFRGSATLLCHIREAPAEDMRFHLRADTATTRCHFMVLWDGEPVIAGPTRPSTDGDELRIPPEKLSVGLHRLELRRVRRLDDPGDRERTVNVFPQIAFGSGASLQRLRPSSLVRYRYVADFLSTGLTGATPWRMAGCLFDGPQRGSVVLDLEDEAAAVFQVENFSSGTARFSITMGERRHSVEVGASQRADLRVALARGRPLLILEVAGRNDGLFLWGSPHLQQSRRELPGPVVLLTLDTTRRDALSPFGAPAGVTPSLGALAEHSSVYTNAHTTAPWTLPSHASIFTGLYPGRHGAGVTHDRLPGHHETLAEILRDRGYFTAGFAGGELSASHWGVGQGFLAYRDPEGFETRGDRLTDAVEAFVGAHRSEPLFLFVNYFDPHALYEAPADFQEMFGVAALKERVAALEYWKQLFAGNLNAWAGIIAGKAPVNGHVLEYLRAAYLAEVAFMDAQIGRLFETLKRYRLYDSALIVVAGDHGELLGEHGLFTHGCRLDRELTEIPLLVKWPGQTAPRRVDDLVSLVDLFATILDAVGATGSAGDGRALAPDGLAGRDDRTAVLMEEHRSRIHPLFENMMIAPHLYGVHRGHSREVVWEGGSLCEVLAAGEWSEAPCSAPWRERLDEIEGALPAMPDSHPTGSRELSPEDERRLKALGYLQ